MPIGKYSLLVDWNNDGDFGDASEDVTTDVLELQWERGRDVASQLTGRYISGQLEAILKDITGKYASFNSASPLYGNILPGRKVQVQAGSGSFPYDFPIQFNDGVKWTGFLDSIEPQPTVQGWQTARLIAFGPLGARSDRKVSVAMQTAITTSAAITVILDEIGWPAGDRSLDTGKTTLTRWWVDREQFLGALREVEATESGFILETKDGKIAFENRHHRLAAPHITSQATFSDAPAAALSYRDPIRQIDSLPFLFNIFEAQVRLFAVGTLAVLWTHPETGASSPLVTRNGGSITLWANYPNPDSATDAFAVNAWTTPVATTDYLANSASDGGGTNLTSSIAIVATKFAKAMKLVITNNHATLDAYMTFLQARGTPVTQADPVRIVGEDATSQTTYGERTSPISPEWLPDTSEAQEWADFHLGIYKDPIPFMEISIIGNKSAAYLSEALNRDIGDRITLVANTRAKLGINRDFFIEAERHRVTPGPFHEVTWLLSDAEQFSDWWVLDTSALDTQTRLAY